MFIAIHSVTKRVIAQGKSYCECSDNALATGVWADFDSPEGGSVAPYFITTEQFIATAKREA